MFAQPKEELRKIKSRNNMLELYSDYLLTQQHLATATGLAKLMEGHISHDKVTRFLSKEQLDTKKFWQYVKPKLKLCENSSQDVLIVDDTIAEKAYTKETQTVCWHYDHAKGRVVKGINIISCMLASDTTSLPTGYEIIKKTEHCYDKKSEKQKRQSKETKNQIFRRLISQAKRHGIAFKHVLADSWFGSKENMNHLHSTLETKYILGIKSNRLICLTAENGTKKRCYLSLKKANLTPDRPYSVWVKGVNHPLTLLKKVFKNGNGSVGSLYLVSNDLSLNSNTLYSLYQKRWKVEEYHRSLKQNVSLCKSPCWKDITQGNHVFLVLIGYCKLEMLKIKTKQNPYALRNRLLLQANLAAWQELRRLQKLAA
jgi:hypothetical protein